MDQPRNPQSAFASKRLHPYPAPELVPRRPILPAGASADVWHLPILRGEGLSPRGTFGLCPLSLVLTRHLCLRG